MTTSGSRTDEGPPAISDLDLMRYLDGELDEPELAELEAQLAADEQACGKLAGLEQVGDFVRQTVAVESRADSIADAIMASIDAEGGIEDRTSAEDDPIGIADDDGAEIIELPDKPKLQTMGEAPLGDRRPANDNSRLIYAIFGVAAAVAAGLFVWGNTDPAAERVAMVDPPPVAAEPASVAEPGSVTAVRSSRGKAEAVAAVEDEEEPVVEIDTVDFGAQSGSVFYVSAGNNATKSTAVVWVTDLGD